MVWLYVGGVDGGGEDRRLCVTLVERLNENDYEILRLQSGSVCGFRNFCVSVMV